MQIMKKTILFIMLCILISGIISCSGENKADVFFDESEPFNEVDDHVGTFSYDKIFNYLEKWGGFRGHPNDFKNTTETEIKSKEDVIELAKNELLVEHIQSIIYIYYDRENFMWLVHFYLDDLNGGHNNQHVLIDNKGITRYIAHNISIEGEKT